MTAEDYRKRATEAEMEQAIREAVTARGGRMFHVRDSRNAPETADLPDLLIFLPGHVYIIELKSQDRKLTPGQAEVMALLETANTVFGKVVRPKAKSESEWSFDLLMDLITETYESEPDDGERE